MEGIVTVHAHVHGRGGEGRKGRGVCGTASRLRGHSVINKTIILCSCHSYV